MDGHLKNITAIISRELSLPERSVSGVIRLLGEGATVPFISRYRKEMTGAMDEERVAAVKLSYERLRELLKRRETILSTIEDQGRLTAEFRLRIEDCYDPSQLEDIYLPYKPKRRTKASVARERGLEPLAALIMRQDGSTPKRIAERFVRGEVEDNQAALDGACDIIAEWVSESEKSRSAMRRLFMKEGTITSKVVKGKEEEGTKFLDYFAWEEPVKRVPSHRLLAMIRGEREGILRLTVSPNDERALSQLERIFVRGNSPVRYLVEMAVKDCYKRLLKPSMESETLSAARAKADTEAIRVFAANLRQLLLSAPLGQHRVMGIDPGFRSGCKVVCLDAQGVLLYNTAVYPHPPQNNRSEAVRILSDLIKHYSIEAIAIGDGTAGRETDQLVRSMGLLPDIRIFMVSEDGASVYSASATAREELPEYDVTVRGAVSIGRRLIDPLAELVKIDPKSIGVGQYQHDVDQKELKQALDSVVESCVNHVGVNLNTASKHLLAYVSGLGASLASNIVEYRTVNGAFSSRAELKKVPRLGAKAFEQAAGFLRIEGAKNPLDNSAVHPESYHIIQNMASDLGVSVSKFLDDRSLQSQVDIKRYVSDKAGLPTLTDIMNELAKPARDPRTTAEVFEFAHGIHSVDDLSKDMILPGIVTNITNFGAFVDIGVKQDGLVHISQLADKYIASPHDVVKLHQHVKVRVTEVDKVRKRIGLSMKNI